MTTKTDDIKLPELPVAVPWHKGYDRESLESYARAAVEADRREYLDTLKLARAIVNGHRRDNPPEDSVEADCLDRVPSNEDLDKLSDDFHGFAGNHTRDGYLIPKFDYIGFARALLCRYRSSQPAAADGMATLRAALAADPDYAWSWHCAVWAAAHDEGLETGAANRAAARLMRAAFDVDTTKNPNFSSAHLMTKKEQQ